MARVRALFRRLERSDGDDAFFEHGALVVGRARERLPGLAPGLLTVKSLGYRLARPPREEADPEAGSGQA
jgi:hypothetical protein